MMTISEIRNNRQLLNDIDWNMTPEEAVRLYLEWGNNWARGNYVIRSKDDVSHYFVVNTWKEKPVLYLVRRNSEIAQDLARIELPHPIAERFMQSVGYNKGVYAVDGELRQWLQQELGLQAATS
ncbi:DVU0772 family protein [Desulfatirhabdium butyrativorans]|uniref:DVU0772 family protein n=1 Tax=Desulfatirhabdium butyrativorans TaxID=340467 RepID=UPI00042A7123|nr:hypothetical protein [Desulfatirhabdium butyrativorans]